MTLHNFSREDLAEMMGDPKAIGRPSGQPCHSAKPEPVCAVSALRASVRRMVRSPDFYASLIIIAIWAGTFRAIWRLQ